MGYRAVEFRGVPNACSIRRSRTTASTAALGPTNQDPRTGRMVLDSAASGAAPSHYDIIGNSPNSFVEDNGTTHLVVAQVCRSVPPRLGFGDRSTSIRPSATEPSSRAQVSGGADFTLDTTWLALIKRRHRHLSGLRRASRRHHLRRCCACVSSRRATPTATCSSTKPTTSISSTR